MSDGREDNELLEQYDYLKWQKEQFENRINHPKLQKLKPKPEISKSFMKIFNKVEQELKVRDLLHG